MGSTGELLQKLQEGRGDEALRGLYALDGSDASLEKGRERAVRVVRAFEAEFGARPEAALFSGPGRTEIGGNHTDHQHGRVLCGSVDLDMLACAAPNGTDLVRIQSEGYPALEVDLRDLKVREEEKNSSPALVRGVAARLAELGRVPYSAKKFFVKHQDRILFGTDCTPLSMGYHKIYYRFFETKDEYFPYQPEGELPGQGRWAIYGIGLEDEILKKIYYKNACKVLSLDENRFVGGVR